jgi:hypothetical protein
MHGMVLEVDAGCKRPVVRRSASHRTEAVERHNVAGLRDPRRAWGPYKSNLDRIRIFYLNAPPRGHAGTLVDHVDLIRLIYSQR